MCSQSRIRRTNPQSAEETAPYTETFGTIAPNVKGSPDTSGRAGGVGSASSGPSSGFGQDASRICSRAPTLYGGRLHHSVTVARIEVSLEPALAAEIGYTGVLRERLREPVFRRVRSCTTVTSVDPLRKLSSMRKALLAIAACRCDGDCPIVAQALSTPARSRTRVPLRGRR